MGMARKAVRAAKLSIKNPKIAGKGIKNLILYGVKGVKEKTKEEIVKTKEEEIVYSVFFDACKCDKEWIEGAINSVCNQNFQRWELFVLYTEEQEQEIKKINEAIKNKKAEKNRQKTYNKTEEKKHKYSINYQKVQDEVEVAVTINKLVQDNMKGIYALMLSGESQLREDALFEIYTKLDYYYVDAFYADHIILDEMGSRKTPVLKPDLSIDLLCGYMYTGKTIGYRKDVFKKLGGYQEEKEKFRDYELFFKAVENMDYILHVAKPIFLEKEMDRICSEDVVARHFRRISNSMAYIQRDEDLQILDIRYKLEIEPKASIIIPTKDHMEDLKAAIDSIFQKTLYKNFEIIILNNNSTEEKTFQYFEEIKSRYNNVKIVDASYSFNWSKLNNHGIRESTGDVYVFLNNDVSIIDGEWLGRMVEKAVQKNVGVVGAMLLFPDDTIQHAGVVVGMNGYASHVYSGATVEETGEIYISPLITRNVLACTGACYAISKDTIKAIGGFDEKFIICGSDVEICIRAYEKGYRNLYESKAKLYHYESKSRDSYIPDIDFTMSERAYKKYWKKGDPFYNQLLDSNSVIPKIDEKNLVATYGVNISCVHIPEIGEYHFKKVELPEKRLNIIVPTVNPEFVFGGISTAIKLFDELAAVSGYAKRIITSDSDISDAAKKIYRDKYDIVEADTEKFSRNQLVSYCDRKNNKLSVSENDIFVFTSWWSAYCIQEAYKNVKMCVGLIPNKFIYLVQDYEPGFYAWSTKYILADATYKCKFPQIAIYNSHWLQDYFKLHGYKFDHEFCFEPILNKNLKEHLDQIGEKLHKKKQILVYGRPSVDRNAFELIVETLRQWVELQEDAEEWRILSAGESHPDVYIGKGKLLESVGKMSLEEYARILETTYAGISLMVSPHPSYPPLEMAAFGVKVITNGYDNKNLDIFSRNMTSIDTPSASDIANRLYQICLAYEEHVLNDFDNEQYKNGTDAFAFMEDVIKCL